MSKKVRLGIIGIGNMGGGHVSNICGGNCPEIELAAVADINPNRLKSVIDMKVNNDGNEIKMEVKVGEKVIIRDYAGTNVKLDGEEYIIVRQDDIAAIVED